MFPILRAFWDGLCRHTPRRHHTVEEKQIRDTISEPQLDKMVDDSFPASDPPSTY